MSNAAHLDNCQFISTKLQTTLQPFFHEIEIASGHPSTAIPLSLTPEQLALTAAFYTPNLPRKIVIPSSDFSDISTFLEQVRLWTSFRNANEKWHIISDSLTEQEQEGIVHTETSNAYRHLLTQTPNHHFIISPGALDTPLPDPDSYMNNHISFTIGETSKLQDIVTRLVDRGYTRHTTSLEQASFRVRGESIDIHPPTTQHHFTVTLHGSTLEK
ncbi:MAG: hypothetical protein WEC84_02110, partial [Candidatus Andersenbacteria bacterium]